MRRVYFDTSAVVKLLRAESYSHDVERWADDSEIEAVGGMLLELELRRTAQRLGVAQDRATAVLEKFDLFDHPLWEWRAAGVIPEVELRSLDALHVAAALRVEADALITYDERMVAAAAAMGMPVIRPGMGDAMP